MKLAFLSHFMILMRCCFMYTQGLPGWDLGLSFGCSVSWSQKQSAVMLSCVCLGRGFDTPPQPNLFFA